MIQQIYLQYCCTVNSFIFFVTTLNLTWKVYFFTSWPSDLIFFFLTRLTAVDIVGHIIAICSL